MHRFLLPLLITASLAAAEERPRFPEDYKPNPCAPAKVCQSYPRGEIVGMGARTLGLTALRQDWVAEHFDEIIGSFGPACRKVATCYAQPGNTFMFCDDIIVKEMPATCDRYPKSSNDYEQCNQLVRVYANGLTLMSQASWREAQACTMKTPPSPEPRKLEVWMSPATLPHGFDGRVTVYALDVETRVPVKASVTVGTEIIYTKEVPDGTPTTWYWFPWKTKLVRVANAQGHRDVVPPALQMRANGYEPVTMPMPVAIPKMIVEMTPSTLKRGKNSVTVTARDSETGAPVEARVMFGHHTVLGQTNEPLEIELARGEKRREIWVTSMYDRYSDVVVAPAER
ncbi:MAG TPA: hypothetical protein VNA69_06345 [Thermoanaerobaculia bacterium]|nr:hypothetical protein [Thermoanaerobaculia bacterium]